jgi:hypothetical protein
MAISVNYILRSNNSEQWVEGLFGLSAPNFIQWSSNSGTAVTGEITDGLIAFKDLIPNYDGVFTFDLSHFARARMQQVDRGDIRADYNEFEDGLAVKFTATVTVNLSVGSPDTLAINPFWFIAAYRQVKNTDKASFWREGVTTIQEGVTALGRVLLPTDHLMRFEGYPIDVNIFHNDFRGDNEKPYRIYRTDADNNLIGSVGFLDTDEDFGVVCVQVDDIPEGGAKIWTATTGNDTRVQRPFTIHSRDFDGVYLRWLNSYGGWSYWLFEGRKVERLSQENNGAAELWTPDPFRVETMKGLRKSSLMRWGIGTAGIERWMFDHLQDLPVSRNVYLWMGERACEQTCVWRVEGVSFVPYLCITLSELITISDWGDADRFVFGFDASSVIGSSGQSGIQAIISPSPSTISAAQIFAAWIASYNSFGAILAGFGQNIEDYITYQITYNQICFYIQEDYPAFGLGNAFSITTGFYNVGSVANTVQDQDIEDWVIGTNMQTPPNISDSGANAISYGYTFIQPYTLQIFTTEWTTVTPTYGVYESTTEFTQWRIIDSENNVIESGTPTVDCRIEGDWLPVQVTQFAFTPQRESEIKQIAVEIELPEQYTPVI